MIAHHPILTEALAFHQDGNLERAAALYRRVLAEEPADPNALHLLGVACLHGDRTDGEWCATLMRRALVSDPTLVPACINLSALRQRLGLRIEGTVRLWLAAEPDNAAALERLGRAWLVDGRLEAGARGLMRAERLGGGSDRLGLALERVANYRRIVAASRNTALEPGIVVRGVFRDGSGYAHKVRQFVRHMVAAGVRVHLIDLGYMPTDDLTPDQIDPALLALDRPVRAKAVLSFATPPTVEALPGLMTLNYSVFEAARIPEMWARHSRRHDHIIVATPSSRDAWTAAGVPAERVAICPEGVEPVDPATINPFTLTDTAGRRLGDYRTRFVNVSDFNPRKNLRGLLRVWLQATRADDDAALLIKIGKGDAMAQLFAATIRVVMDQVGRPVEEAAPIFLVDGKFSDAGMLSLFATGTHYWSMSHGEGWDLPMAQAAAIGLTPVAPAHSAYTAYLDDTVAHMLPSREVEAFNAYKGLSWWEPDEEAAIGLITRIIRNPDSHRRSARARLCRDFSWERATARLIDHLTAIGAL